MRALQRGKEACIGFFSEYDSWVRAALRFGIAFVLFWQIGGADGGMERILLKLIAAAFCSFLPAGFLILFAAVFLELQLYACSLASALAGACVILLWLLLYVCFASKQTYAVALTVLLLCIRLPFAVPLVCGLLLGPGAAAGICLGAAAYYLAKPLGRPGEAGIAQAAKLLEETEDLLKSLTGQKELLIVLVLLLAVFLVVSVIRRMPVSYSWQLAIGAGAVVYGLLSAMERLMLDGGGSWLLLTADLGLGLAAGAVVQFFCFSLDYRKVSRLQFEDDDYYYYVKAVPKRKSGETTAGKEWEENEQSDSLGI